MSDGITAAYDDHAEAIAWCNHLRIDPSEVSRSYFLDKEDVFKPDLTNPKLLLVEDFKRRKFEMDVVSGMEVSHKIMVGERVPKKDSQQREGN